MNTEITLNKEQSLYVIPVQGGGFTCLGFDVCRDWTNAIAVELNRPDLKATEYANLEAYEQYKQVLSVAQSLGNRLTCMLTPQLIGLERKRVEVIDAYGEKRRFYVGKSTGFLPVHLEIARRDSSGGSAVSGAPFKSVKVVR